MRILRTLYGVDAIFGGIKGGGTAVVENPVFYAPCSAKEGDFPLIQATYGVQKKTALKFLPEEHCPQIYGAEGSGTEQDQAGGRCHRVCHRLSGFFRDP